MKPLGVDWAPTSDFKRYLLTGDFASIVAATVRSAAVVTVTFIPVAKLLSAPGRPFTVILVAGVTLYSLD